MNETACNHNSFYSQAYFYDLAFRFKDVTAENGTLIKIFEKINERKPGSFCDIAAGPALNAIQMAKVHELTVQALDYSQEMVAYGLKRATEEDVPLRYVQSDMRNFQLHDRVDMAAIFMASTGYLLRNEDMVSHLKAVADNLNPFGIYALEMPHPRDVFSVDSSTSTEWEMKDADCVVKVQWGEKGDAYDPIEQTTNVTARLCFETPNENGEIVDRCLQREYTYQEMKALVELSGVFDWVDTLGAWNLSVPFSNEKRAWRMIPILRRKEGERF